MEQFLTWFEIPCINIERAQEFYESVFEVNLKNLDNDGTLMRVFTGTHEKQMLGALIQGPNNKVSPNGGVLIYLNAHGKIDTHIKRVEVLGGKITTPKTKISDEYGYMAVFRDTEGNLIALHSSEETED